MKKILVPTDFSKPAEYAAEVALGIAEKAKGQIILLHIVELPGADSFNAEGQISYTDDWEEKIFAKKLIDFAKQQLAKIAERLRTTGVEVSTQLGMGSPYRGISKIIADREVDLVVMGTSGRTKLEEMVIGSNTEKVVRHAHCPVLTVHKKPGTTEFKNIVYATSMSEDEKSFAEVVLNAQDLYGSTVHIVRINTPLNFKPDTEVKPVMESFAKKLRLKNYTLNVFNDLDEEKGIIHFANSLNADLIAMATHGRTGLAHALIGSIAEDVANHSPRPVLTFVTKNGK